MRVVWSHTRRVFTVRDAVQFLNPLVSVEDMSRFLESEVVATTEHLQEPLSLKSLKRNSDRCKLLLVKSYKVDSAPQGLPVHSLVCSRGEVEYVGGRAKQQSRLDWIRTSGR